MQGPLNQFAALNNTSMEAMLDAALVLAEGAANLGRLQFEAAKVLLQESAEAGRHLSAVKSFEDLTPKTKAVAVTSIEKALGYSRNVYDITTGTSVQLFELLNATSLNSVKVGVRAGRLLTLPPSATRTLLTPR
jgi:phasin family protein